MGVKNFKTLDEQIEILKNKGLVINNEEYAKEIILKENYFFLGAYRFPFLTSLENRKYIPGTTFEELYGLFLFDRHFRYIIFKNMLIIENNMKSIISYQLSKQYGYREKDYLKESNFTDEPGKGAQINDLIKKMKRQIRMNGPQHAATIHYMNNYGYIPLWVLVKVLSFGIISELFQILKYEDRSKIASIYNLDVENLSIYLPLLANYRNICAHEDIVYEKKTQREINDTYFHRKLNIPMVDGEYIYGKNDMFTPVIILKYMLSKEEFDNLMADLKKRFEELEGRLKIIPLSKILDRMGFPENWYDLKEMQRMV